MYNAYMKLKRSVEKWHADQLRRRMVRKIIYLKKNRTKKICGLNFLLVFSYQKFIFIVYSNCFFTFSISIYNGICFGMIFTVSYKTPLISLFSYKTPFS